MDKKYYSELIWNSIGGCINSITSFFFLMLVTRIAGIEEGGIFSLAYTAAQIFISIGKFGVRPYHSTDIKFQMSFSDYCFARVIHFILMLFFFVFYLFCAGYEIKKNLIFIFILFIKGVEVFEDLYHGELQRRGYLDIAGMLLSIRSMGTLVCWTAMMLLSKDLFLTSMVTAIISFIIGLVINVDVSKRYFPMSYNFDLQQIKSITKECFLICLSTFFSLYIYNFPKFVVERVLSDSCVTIYSILFMPTFVINLFSDFYFKPIMRKIATIWREKDKKQLFHIIRNQCIGITLLTIIFIITMFGIGIDALEFIYGVNISGYHKELLVLLIAGGGSAITYFFFNLLSAIRAQKILIVNYILGALCITVTSIVLTVYYKIVGSAVAFLVTEILMCLIMFVSALFFINKRRNSNEIGNNDISKNE